MGVVVLKAGLCTTIQDRGRTGYLAQGMSPSGAADLRALATANILVGNDADAPAIEFCVQAPELRFLCDGFIAVTGGDFCPLIDGEPVALYAALRVRRGAVLSFGRPRSGAFGYVAIAGGSLDVAPVMGSRSTNLRCGIGGWQGRALRAGDRIGFVTEGMDYLPALSARHVADDVAYYGFDQAGPVTLRVVPGPQEDLFGDEGLATFYGSAYEVTGTCDRMGYRLEGPPVATVAGNDIPSDGIVCGAIQVPSHGRPIVMLADRQTTGGYAKIGCVASVDIPRLVQRRPGQTVRFERIDVRQAQQLYLQERARLEELARVVSRLGPDDESPRQTARRLARVMGGQGGAVDPACLARVLATKR